MNEQDHRFLAGRLGQAANSFVQRFTASVEFDKRLYKHDIEASVAHVRMLCKTGHISISDQNGIIAGLQEIGAEIAAGSMDWQISLEDVHMNIEHRLIELLGSVGKKLHMGRSRNDQVATDMRLFLREAVDRILADCRELLSTLLDLAERETETLMPGMTHLQIAQPITFGHHMMAWVAMLERDIERFHDCRKRINRLPLGAAAFAGTSIAIDREYVSSQLGFSGLCQNSIDAVSDRDFAIEFCATASMLMMHFSRWTEELVLWSSAQFDFIDLPDELCTSSSIMPQKKNPDVPELIRGKTGRIYGHLISLLTLMKSQPLAYNKDNQEDKEPLFDAVDTTENCIRAMIMVIDNLSVKRRNLLEAAESGFSTATDFADYLARKGIPFRDAHHIVGRAVSLALDRKCSLTELSIEELKSLHPAIEPEIYDILEARNSISSRNHPGGTAPEAVWQAITRSRQKMQQAG